MERESDERQKVVDRKLTWEQLDIKDKLVYIEQAEYLIAKGYIAGNAMIVAEAIYSKRR